ncbi:ArsA family ATPase [Neisseria leonii]|uniref:arsenite-transporting ATPase n=1 Tax=Neisseria leonii TaxID=2995413 RepID=A0A9X4E3G2_9NEIS|nr:ArsA family ATPase [Neisseria sp. 51.81]MDD9328009.1 ArsA family ATPase [Neisseria sp. 51.81]
MDVLLQEALQKKLLFVGGKGGVGKTTHAAALACRLADAGRRVLLVSTDPAHSLGDVLDVPLSGTVRALGGGLSAVELNPAQITDRHFERVAETVAAYTRPEMAGQMRRHLDAAKASPGAEEAALLEAVCGFVVNHRIMGFDQVVFDTAPTGHTLRLLELPQMMAAWTDGLLAQQGRQSALREAALPFWRRSGREQTLLSEAKHSRWQKAADVLAKRRELFERAGRLLADAANTSIVLVMVPEMLPLAETRRALAQLAHFGLPCRHVIVNQMMVAQADDSPFWQQRYRRQADIMRQIGRDLAAVTRHHYALQAEDIRGRAALQAFSQAAYLGSGPPQAV